MKALVCTCSDNKDIHDCPIHMLPRTKSMLKRRYTTGEYQLVCLCDCKCTSCIYTPMSQVLEKNENIIVLFFDDKGKSHRMMLTQHDIIE